MPPPAQPHQATTRCTNSEIRAHVDPPAKARHATGRHAVLSIDHGHGTHAAMRGSEAARIYQSAYGHKQCRDVVVARRWNGTGWRGRGWRPAHRACRIGSAEGTAARAAHTFCMGTARCLPPEPQIDISRAAGWCSRRVPSRAGEAIRRSLDTVPMIRSAASLARRRLSRHERLTHRDSPGRASVPVGDLRYIHLQHW